VFARGDVRSDALGGSLVFARGDVRSDALGGSTAWLVTSRSARDFIGWRP